jgi:steroid delta-isomerase-like uncharacterized protein
MKRSLNLLITGAMGMLLFAACAKTNNQTATGDSATVSGAATTNGDANKTVAKNFYENVFNAHKADAASQYIAANGVNHSPEPGHTGQGLEDIQKELAEFITAFPDIHFSVDQQVAEGDMVATLLTMTGTNSGAMGPGMPATNKAVKVQGLDLVRIKDGKLVDRWGYFDSRSMMMQMGMMPPPAGAGVPPAPKK